MLKRLAYYLLLYFALWLAVASAQTLPKNLVSFDSSEGKILLRRSLDEDYLKLSMQFLTQKNQAYCGVASMVMVLNALGIVGPFDPVFAPFHPFTQDNFFTEAVKRIVPIELVSRHGLTLEQAAQLAAQFSVHAHAIHSDSINLIKMRYIFIHALIAKNKFVIINFFRPGLKEEGGGHFSPIAAYDVKTDRFLILDVARYRYPPVWAKSVDIWHAINTIDSVSNKTRGILLIDK